MEIQTGWQKVMIFDHLSDRMVETRVPVMFEYQENGLADTCRLWERYGIARHLKWECKGCQWLPKGVEL